MPHSPDCPILQAFIAANLTKKVVVAYSGGMDSHVLLHALVAYQQTLQLSSVRAIYIDHQLQDQSDRWGRHCVRTAEQLGVDCQVGRVTVTIQAGDSLEAQARAARYAQLTTMLAPDETLLTAQHQDDQLETVLLQLLRGAGVAGLAAMPAAKAFANSCLCRPLLKVSQLQLAHYAQQHQLHWIDDPSNSDARFDRNYLCTQVLPHLRQRWPQLGTTLGRVAQHCAHTDALLTEYVQQDYALCVTQSGTLKLKRLKQFSQQRCYLVLRHWLKRAIDCIPDQKHIVAIMTMLTAREDAQPCVHFKGVEVRRFQQQLYVMPKLLPHDPHQQWELDLQSDFVLPNQLGTLTLSELHTLLGNRLPYTSLTIRFRQGGERFGLPGRNHSVSLKQYLHTQQVQPWLRDRVPLLYDQNELVAIWGLTCTEVVARQELT